MLSRARIGRRIEDVMAVALAEPFHVIAHRGASGYAPENTMAAFRRAVEVGATEVETDVGFTRDGHILLLHDDTLDRTTNGSGRPEDFMLAELQELDAGSWRDAGLSWDRDYSGEKLITLDQLLDEFGSSLTYHIELKRPTPGLPEAVVAAVRAHGLADNVYLFSIEDEAGLRRARQMEPRLRIAWAPEQLLRDDPRRAVERCAANGFSMITLNATNQSAALVQFAHDNGLEARSSGISNREKMVAAAEIGCNGMTINWPDWLLEYVRDHAAC
jgi:glycerophosphoryl diester phosphodiesterase